MMSQFHAEKQDLNRIEVKYNIILYYIFLISNSILVEIVLINIY